MTVKISQITGGVSVLFLGLLLISGCGRKESDSPTLTETTSGPSGSAATAASETEVAAYRELYSSGVIREIRFDQEADPNEAAREEIFLEAELAKRAQGTSVAQDRLLRADIDYYQGVEILNAWLQKEAGADAVSSEAIEQYYREHQAEFAQPERVTFHHLFLMVPPGDPNAEQKKLEEAKKIASQLERGADFERLAVETSELPAAKTDKGKVGPVETQRLNPAIQAGLKSLQPGGTSGPVRTPYGWELLRLDERVPAVVKPLEDVREQIAAALIRQKAERIQQSAAAKLNGRFAAKVNDDVLSGTGPVERSTEILQIGEQRYTAGDVLDAIAATHSFTGIKDERERIRSALPRIILTEQVKAAARADGLLEKPEMQAKLRLIANRLLAEAYFNRMPPSATPTDEEVRAKYEEGKTTLFRKPPEGKGVLYMWNLPEGADRPTSGSELAFRRQLLRQQVEEIARKARSGEITSAALASQTSETKVLDWFQEGPMGFQLDTAFFGTEAGQFTPVFQARNGWAFAYVDAKKDPEPIPFEEAQDKVRKLLTSERLEADRQALIEEILKRYARAQ